MRRICSSSALLILAATVSAGDTAKPDMTPKQRLIAILAEHKAAEAAYFKAVDALPDTPERNKRYGELFAAYDKGQTSRFLAALSLAKAEPMSEASFDALEWML